jgi:HSP20 family protein
MSYKDYRDVFRLMEREMQQFSDDVFHGFFDPAGSRFWQPQVDIYESDTDLIVRVELAGAKSEELSVSLSADERFLSFGGIRKEPTGERCGPMRCHQLEIYFGPFERAVPLPAGVRVLRDEIKAVHRDGFLVVTLPKMTEAPKLVSRTIPITNDETDTVADEKS